MEDHTGSAVRRTLATYFEVDPSYVRPEQHLLLDWGVDAGELQLIARRIALQEGIEIRPRDLRSVETVGRLITLVQALCRRSDLASHACSSQPRVG